MEFIRSATIYLTILAVGTCAISGGIQEFLVDNGQRHVDIFYNSSQLLGFLLKDLFIARFRMEDIGKGNQDSFGIFMFDSAKDNLVSYLEAIMQRKIKMSLLFTSEPLNKENINLMKKHLSDMQASAFFYIAMPTSSSDMTWHQVILLKSGCTFNHLKFADNSSRIIETFDLQGLQITSTSLTWDPYLTLITAMKMAWSVLTIMDI